MAVAKCEHLALGACTDCIADAIAGATPNELAVALAAWRALTPLARADAWRALARATRRVGADFDSDDVKALDVLPAAGKAMDFTIDRTPFLSALSTAAAVADRKSTLQLLANVLLRCGKDSLLVAATNLVTTVSANLPATAKAQGEATVSARDLYAFVKSLPGQEVRLSLTEQKTLTVRSGKTTANFPTIDPKDFPNLPDHREVEMRAIDPALLRTLLAKTLPAVSIDTNRATMMGVHVRATKGGLTVESCNGYRLACIKRAADLGELDVLIPLNGGLEMARLLDGSPAAHIGTSKGYVFLQCGALVLALQLLSGQFPDIDRVTPARSDMGTVDRSEMIASLRRIGMFADAKGDGERTTVEHGGGVKLTLDKDTMWLAATSGDGAAGDDSIACEWRGEAITLGLPVAMLVDVLETMDGAKATVQIDNPLAPLVLRPIDGDEMYIVMPKRL